MGEFLKDYGGHLIGAVALVQVWAIAAWKRFIQRPKVSFHPSGQIRLSFGELGPSLWLLGTFRSTERPVFLERLSCRVTRAKDNATHTFDWEAVRSTAVEGGSRDQMIATGFLIQPAAPASRQVMFAVSSIRRDHEELATQVQREWSAFAEQRLRKMFNDTAERQIGPEVKAALFDEFAKTEAPLSLYRKMNNECFWHTGRVTVELVGIAAELPPLKLGCWEFDLSPDDEERLRNNAVAALRSKCGVAAFYHSVLREYRTVDATAKPRLA